MLVSITSIDVQTLQGVLGNGVAGHHAADGHAHSQLGLVLHQDAILGLLQTADPTGVSTIVLILHLVTGQNSLAGVDNDDVIAAVSVGGVGDFALAAQQVGDDDSGLAQGLAGGINDIPLALNVGLVCHKSGHGVFPPIYIYIALHFHAPLLQSGERKSLSNAQTRKDIYSIALQICQRHFDL